MQSDARRTLLGGRDEVRKVDGARPAADGEDGDFARYTFRESRQSHLTRSGNVPACRKRGERDAPAFAAEVKFFIPAVDVPGASPTPDSVVSAPFQPTPVSSPARARRRGGPTHKSRKPCRSSSTAQTPSRPSTSLSHTRSGSVLSRRVQGRMSRGVRGCGRRRYGLKRRRTRG